jgi:hypothetical protein
MQAMSPNERALTEVLVALAGHGDAADMCSTVLDFVGHEYKATSSWVLLHDEQRRALVPVECRGVAGAVYTQDVPIDAATITGTVFSTAKPMFVGDLGFEKGCEEVSRMRSAGFGSALVLPLVSYASPVGVVGLDSPAFSAAAGPARRDMALLQAVAGQLAAGSSWLARAKIIR